MATIDLLAYGYTSDEVRDALNVGSMAEEENVIQTI